MKTYLAHFMSHWKTTANGILSFLVTTLTTVSGFLGSSDLINGGASLHSIHPATWVVISVNLSLALCRGWIGLIQKDSGTTPATLPGSNTPVALPSHEVPDNPAATPIVKEQL